jgi:succinate dehydrogenase/fumarate reductase cytochrome b subunit
MNNHVRSAAYSARNHAPEWIEKFARFGIAAKGAVYVLIGVLAAMAAFGQGGSTGGQENAFQWVVQQPFGQILLGIVIIGLLGYVVWRMIMAFKDPDGYGSDAKGLAKRAGFFFSGLVYLFFAFSAARMLFSELGSSGSGGGQETLIAKALQQPFGQILVGIFAVIVICKGLYQLYRGVAGKFKGQVNERTMSREEHAVYTRSGRVGYIARGIVFAILGYFLVQAALQSDASEAGGTGEALNFLSSTGGPYIMGAVAIGLAAYGVFMFVKSKYRYIPNVHV